VSPRNIKNEIKDAASVAKRVSEYADKQLDKVASGKTLKAQIKVIPESRFPMWATTLTSLICAQPELANLTNKKLAALIENENGETGLNHTIISKKLNAGQHRLVAEILRKHGYATDTLDTGSDIKRIVSGDIRLETPKDDGVRFYADGIEILGKRFSYRQRSVTPNGKPWHDFCVRLSGDDTSLQAVLVARGIGINEFVNRDEVACACASQEETAKRQELNRPAQRSRRLSKLTKTIAKSSAVLPHIQSHHRYNRMSDHGPTTV